MSEPSTFIEFRPGMRRLIEDGLVTEAGHAESVIGKPRTLLNIATGAARLRPRKSLLARQIRDQRLGPSADVADLLGDLGQSIGATRDDNEVVTLLRQSSGKSAAGVSAIARSGGSRPIIDRECISRRAWGSLPTVELDVGWWRFGRRPRLRFSASGKSRRAMAGSNDVGAPHQWLTPRFRRSMGSECLSLAIRRKQCGGGEAVAVMHRLTCDSPGGLDSCEENDVRPARIV